jgi:hypothetical protein
MGENIIKIFKAISIFVIFIFCLLLSCKNIPLKSDYAQENKIKQNIAVLKDNDWSVSMETTSILINMRININ